MYSRNSNDLLFFPEGRTIKNVNNVQNRYFYILKGHDYIKKRTQNVAWMFS